MSQAMMFHGEVELRTILLALAPSVRIQDGGQQPESPGALLDRLVGPDREDGPSIPELLVAGINREGGLVFVKTRMQQTKGKPVAINLSVPPPARFRIVPYDASAIAKQLAEHVDAPPSSSN